MIRLRQSEVLEEHLAHSLIVVLPGVHQDLPKANSLHALRSDMGIPALDSCHDGSDLNEIRPSAHDVKD
jgi:hypothetical protein